MAKDFNIGDFIRVKKNNIICIKQSYRVMNIYKDLGVVEVNKNPLKDFQNVINVIPINEVELDIIKMRRLKLYKLKNK